MSNSRFSMSYSCFSVRTRYSVGIFTLQRGLDLILQVAPIFLPRRRASSITLERDAEAHIFSEAHLVCSLFLAIKKGKLRLGQEKSLGGSMGEFERSLLD